MASDEVTVMERERNSAPPIVAGSGLIALDILVKADGGLPVEAYAGGTCGNILAILAFLGWESYPIARIGNDPPGVTLRHDLERFGVSTDFLFNDEQCQTPVIVQRNRRRSSGGVSHKFIWQCPSCGHYLPSFRSVTKALARESVSHMRPAMVFVFDRVSPGTLVLAEHYLSAGAVVLFEPSSIGDAKLFERAMHLCHIVKYSADRLDGIVIPSKNVLKLEIQTLGAKGLRYRSKISRRWKQLDAIEVTSLLDTSGAGDWCTAGILATLATRGIGYFPETLRTLERGIRFGQALAVLNCAFEGARGLMYRMSPSELLSRASMLIDQVEMSVKPGGMMRGPVQQLSSAVCASCWHESNLTVGNGSDVRASAAH